MCLVRAKGYLRVAALTLPTGPQGFEYRPRGGRPAATLAAGSRFLSQAEVEQVFRSGGGAALRSAYEALYKKPTASGNLAWVRSKLTGGR